MTRIAIKRPVLTFVVFAVILIFGGISLSRLPIDFLPDVTYPVITVMIPYPGASATDVERNVTEPMEEALSNVPEVSEIRSSSQEGISSVYVEFEYGKDLDAATNEIRDAIEFVKAGFPQGTEEPILLKFDASSVPVMQYAVVSSDPRTDLSQLLDERLVNELKRAQGVGDVMAFHGAAKREITVLLDRVKFEQYGFSLSGIAQALAASNVNFPVGDARYGRRNLTLRVPAEFKTPQELARVPVGNAGTEVIRLGDIAEVSEGFYRSPMTMRANGTEGSFLIIQKRSGANTVQTANNVKEVVSQIEETYPELSFTVVFNTAEIITTSINNLLRTLLIAFILVVIVSFLLLGNPSAAWITSATIPVSLIAAFIYLYLSDGSINIISLSALAITIGMVVDNGIVVLENIFRQREKGRQPASAAEFGVSEVGQAVLASTLTTVGIFIPFLLVRGFIGIYFRELAISVPIILFASLFTAVTLTPMLASRFLQMRRLRTPKGRTPPLRWIPSGLERLGYFYRGVLDWAVSHRLIVVIIAVVLFLGGLGLFRFIPTSFMGDTDTDFLQGDLALPAGTRFEITDSVTAYVENEIRENYPQVRDILVMGGDYSGQLMDETGTEATARIYLALDEDRELSGRQVAQDINKRFRTLPGIKKLYFYPGGGGPTGQGKDITVDIFGYDISVTDSLAGVIADSLEGIPGFVGVEVSRESQRPELWLEINRERAYAAGLTPAQIGMYLRDLAFGKVATEITSRGEKLEVVLRFANVQDWKETDFESVTIPTPLGTSVPLSNLARFVPHQGPVTIERKEGERLVMVEADLYELALGTAVANIQKLIGGMDFPFGTRAEISGQAEEQASSFRSLFFALVVAIVLVFLIMSAQFENFREPFIIMFSVPFAVTGVAIAFALSGASFGIMGFVGMVLLVGVVVNNAIVLIDYTNLLRRRGKTVREAILDAGQRRLRPVLMTTFTTVFGLAPLAFIPTRGSQMWAPLGVAVIGGLLFSTLVTLILVPVIYSSFERAAEKRRLRKESKKIKEKETQGEL